VSQHTGVHDRNLFAQRELTDQRARIVERHLHLDIGIFAFEAFTIDRFFHLAEKLKLSIDLYLNNFAEICHVRRRKVKGRAQSIKQKEEKQS
jgi:hypothetical protein